MREKLQNRIGQTIGLLIITLLSLVQFSCTDNAKSNNQINKDNSFQPNISNLRLPNKLTLFGENIPLEIPEIRQRAEREFYLLMQQQGQVILYLKRSGMYFPIFERELKNAGMSDDFKFLSVAESALYMARSGAGAVGLWQFMPKTAEEMGLIVNDYIDERRNVLKSTKAAIKYLKSIYETQGSWISAAASYNMGPVSFTENISYQSGETFFDLFLNEETSRYIFRIACIKEIMSNPRKYGFDIADNEKYKQPKTRKVTVTTGIDNMSEFARQYGATYKEIKLLNPWILKRIMPKPSKGSIYEIDFPA